MKTIMRLDKYLADMGVGTRSEVKERIRKSHVLVNGQVVRAAETKVDTENDEICCDGEIVGYIHFEYYMLNKPAGVISATDDKKTETVIDLITSKQRRDLFPVGRLDKDTEGLLMITNDGALAHQLLSPKKHVPKVYYARVAGVVTPEDVQAFACGLKVDEELTAMPARLTILSNASPISEITLEIHEGKFHQVKRMFEAVGKEVVYLKRLSMGPLALDASLAPGEYRALSKDELSMLKNLNDAKAPAAENGMGDSKAPTAANDMNDAKALAAANGMNGAKAPAALKDVVDMEAVIFDMDGTLINSMWVWEDIDREYLARFGLDMPEGLQDAIAGISITQTAIYFKETFGIEDSVEKIIGDWDAMAFEKYSHEIPLKPGTLEFLNALSAAGVRCAIATSSSRRLTDAVMKAHKIGPYFEVILTGEDIHKGKPDPDVYLEAARRLGAAPEKCLVFEDIPYGIMAAKNAGMTCIAVEDDYSAPDREKKRLLADGYIRDFYEIIRNRADARAGQGFPSEILDKSL